MTDWLIEVAGHRQSIQFLKTFLQGCSIHVVTFRRKACLTVGPPPPNHDTQSLIAWATDLVATVNGAASLVWRYYEPAKLGGIHRLAADGSDSAITPLTARRGQVPPAKTSDPTLCDCVAVAVADSRVATALAIYGAVGRDWRGLYMLLEVVEEDLHGAEEITRRRSATQAQLQLFTHTANSFAALGAAARHAKEWSPPAKPMTLHEATVLVEGVLHAWIRSKATPNGKS